MFNIDNTLSFNADKLVPGDEYDYVTRTSLNQGILKTTGFVNKENINPSGTWSLGLLQMDFFYRRKPWYAGQFVRKITPKIKISESAVLFFSTLLNKQKPRLLSVLVRDVDRVFCSTKIKLPVKNGKMDFDFMESFIAELETRHIVELNAYLKVTGLDNYILTDEEQKALVDFKSWEWKQFNLEKLFGKSTRGKRLKSADRIEGELPFVTAGEADEGISAYISNDVDVFEANTTTIDMFGSAKYRNYQYGADDHVAVVHTENLSKFASIFTTTAIHKSAHSGKFSYSRNFYAKDADELDILLPTVDGKINYCGMALLISAIQKMVIRDVVIYSKQKIDTSKKVVESVQIS